MLMPQAVPAVPWHETGSRHTAGRLAVAMIGPEGDFTASEVRMMQRHGAKPISLGPRTLRSETAAIATLVLLQREAGIL